MLSLQEQQMLLTAGLDFQLPKVYFFFCAALTVLELVLSVDQAAFSSESLASASQVLRLKACHSLPKITIFNIKKCS